MNLQLLLVAGIVTAAALYLARSTWRTWRAQRGGCGGCGNSAKKSVTMTDLIPSNQLTLRRRD
jgi:hypothetical protein